MLGQPPSSPPLGKWRALHPFNATLPRTSTINNLPIQRHPSAREGSGEKHGQLLRPPNLFALEQEWEQLFAGRGARAPFTPPTFPVYSFFVGRSGSRNPFHPSVI